MKKHLFISILFAAILCLAIDASATKAAVPVKKVSYQRQIPQRVRMKMPRGSKTRFFGISQLEPKGARVAFHIYELNLSSAGYTTAENPFYLPNCVLEVFVERPSRKRRIFRRVNTVRLNSIRYSAVDFSHSNAFRTVGMGLLWLDTRQRKMPILKIDTEGVALYPGWGTHILVVFPEGLSGAVITQGFGHGADNSTDHNGWGSTFDKVDQKGLLVPHTYRRSFNESSNYNQPLHWNGKEFAPTAK